MKVSQKPVGTHGVTKEVDVIPEGVSLLDGFGGSSPVYFKMSIGPG